MNFHLVFLRENNQSEASIQVTWLLSTNQRQVPRSRDHSWQILDFHSSQSPDHAELPDVMQAALVFYFFSKFIEPLVCKQTRPVKQNIDQSEESMKSIDQSEERSVKQNIKWKYHLN